MSSNSAIDSLRTKRTEQSERENIRGRGRGSVVNYYEDLGFSTTEPAYKKWRAEEDLYQKQKSEDLAIIDKNKSLIAQAQKEYDSFRFVAPNVANEVNKSYQQHANKDLMKVNVIDFKKPTRQQVQLSDDRWGWEDIPGWQDKAGDIYTVEGTYYVPKDSINKLEGIRTFRNSKGELMLSTVSKGPNKTIGKELHEAFGGASSEYEAKYKAAASQQMTSALNQQRSAFDQQKQSALDQISTARSDTQSAEERIRGNEALRVEQLNTLRGNYQNKLNVLKSIFG